MLPSGRTPPPSSSGDEGVDDALRQERDALHERVVFLERELVRLQEQGDALERERVRLATEHGTAAGRAADLEHQRDALRGQRDRLTAQLAGLEGAARERDAPPAPSAEATRSFAARLDALVAAAETLDPGDAGGLGQLRGDLRSLRISLDLLLGRESGGIYIAGSPRDFGEHSLHGARYEPAHAPRLDRPVVVSTLPKSGTYLIRNALVRALGYRQVSSHAMAVPAEPEDLVYAGHLVREPGRPELDELPRIVFARDPRGYVASYVNFIRKVANGEYIWREMTERFPAEADLVRAVVDGYRADDGAQLLGVGESFRRFVFDWMTDGHLLVRYEELFEPGTKTVRSEVLERIAAYIGHPGLGEAMRDGAAPEHSVTFTSAPPDAWRTRLSAESIALVEAASGDIIARLGYDA